MIYLLIYNMVFFHYLHTYVKHNYTEKSMMVWYKIYYHSYKNTSKIRWKRWWNCFYSHGDFLSVKSFFLESFYKMKTMGRMNYYSLVFLSKVTRDSHPQAAEDYINFTAFFPLFHYFIELFTRFYLKQCIIWVIL